MGLTVLCISVHETMWQSLGIFQVELSSHGLWDSYISWTRCLGAVWAWPDLLACTGAALGVTGVDAGATFGTAGMVGTAVVCSFGVTGVACATGKGCASCAGLVCAGCGAEMQGLARSCSVAVVVSGAAWVGLTLHAHRCHPVWQ